MDKTIIKTGNWFVDQLSLYQSANSDNASVRKNFVIRMAEIELIISDLQNKQPADPLQHELILGRRGSGKSTLLKRIQVEVEENEDLQKKYIAINLAEEQAGIYRLFDLWEEVWKELANIYKLDKTLNSYSDFEDDTAFTRYLYAQIHQVLTEQQKKLVLLLDNFDRIVGNFADDGHLLRETLHNYNDVQLVAGSTRMDEHFWRYDKPFYEFFRRHRLEALDIKEIVQLLNHWAIVMELPQLANFTRTNIGKLEAIRILTDGLPRTLQFFIQLLLQNDTLHGYDYLRKIMDNVTPLYQERLNNLPAAQRKILAEMAFIWEACAVKELVDKCRMESKLISAHIKQLTNLGIVDTIGTSKKNHLYRLTERFFNMWLMITQGNPEQKRKAKWLSIFLESWYEADELKALAGEHIGKLKANKLSYDKALVMAKAFTQSKYITIGQRDEILDLTNQLNEGQAPYGMLELPRKAIEISEEIKQCIAGKQFDKALLLVDEIENEVDGLKFMQKGHIYELKGDITNAEKYYVEAGKKGINHAEDILGHLLQSKGEYTKAEKYYLQAIKKGHIYLFNNLAGLNANQKKYSKAEKYYFLGVKHGDSLAMGNLASFYYAQKKISEAERYYLMAIEKGYDFALYRLATMYDKEENYRLAEKYYLKAIEKDFKEAFIRLAFLYEDQNKDTLAEKYYLMAIEKGDVAPNPFSPTKMEAMAYLASFYNDRRRTSEAEKYYLMAIDNGISFAMHDLALLYFSQNRNMLKALQLTNQCVTQRNDIAPKELQICIEVWNGILHNTYEKIENVMIASEYNELDPFLISLLYLEQVNLIYQFFIHPTHGLELQKRYQPLYFAVLQLSGNMDANTKLRIPPEILPVVEDIVKEVKEKQQFYATPPKE